MGVPKATLPFGDQLLWERMIEILFASVERVVLVTNRELPIQANAANVHVVVDEHDQFGPIEGIRLGLRKAHALETGNPDSAVAFVTSCDAPFLKPAWVEQLFDLVGDYFAVVPCDEQFAHPLSAVYRCCLWKEFERLQSEGERRPRAVLDRVKSLRISTNELRVGDPNLESLENPKTP